MAVFRETVRYGSCDHRRPAQLGEFRDMLVTVRDRVAALKKQGKSLGEVISAKPTDAFDSQWGKSLLDGALFT
jgi:hypothetical protein